MGTAKDSGPKKRFTKEEEKKIKRMAKKYTASEIGKVLGHSSQSIQSKATRMGVHLQSPKTNTSFGKKAEQHALLYFPEAELITLNNYHAPYDILWEGKRINVKATKLVYLEAAGAWYFKFTTNKGWDTCDMFLFLGYETGIEYPTKAWLVPKEECSRTTTTLSKGCKKSKFAKYVIEREAKNV